jgi:type IV secretory pathway VirB4 component
MAGRSYRRLRLPPHRATTEVLAGAYPFLAEEGLGSAGALVGQDAWSGTAFCYDPWALYQQGQLTNPNIFLAGQIGRGKSALAKSLACRYIAFGRRVYVPGDPKGEWSTVARAVGGQAVRLAVGSGARLNPLDEGPRPSGFSDEAWQAQVAARRTSLLAALGESTLGRALTPTERTALDAALSDTLRRSGVPVLPLVVDALLGPPAAFAETSVEQLRTDGRDVGHALARLVRGDLAGLFDGPSTVAFDPALPMLSLDLSAVSGSEMLIGLVMTCASTWLEAALADAGGGQRLVVYDEAWRLLAQPALLARMQAQWKLSRAWGLANLMIVHRLSDLDAVGDLGSQSRGLAQGLLGDTATRVIYNQPFDEARAAGKLLGLTSVEVDQLPELAQGEGLWRVNERAFVVRHLLTEGELALFDTNARMTPRA